VILSPLALLLVPHERTQVVVADLRDVDPKVHSPPDYIDGMLRAIVGIEIEIKRIEGKAKLSQNRETRDRLKAADTLSAKGHDELGRAMREAQ